MIPPKILLASSNEGKIKEFKLSTQMLSLDVEWINQSEFNIADVPETGLSFIENALIKARHAAKFSPYPVVSDDSGLIVDALNGAPGIYSARYAGKNASREAKNTKLISELNQLHIPFENRTARLYCVLIFLRSFDDPLPIIAEGYWEGLILDAPQGIEGFGYEPIFYLPSYQCSAAQIPLSEKLSISHRGHAIVKLFQQLKHLT